MCLHHSSPFGVDRSELFTNSCVPSILVDQEFEVFQSGKQLAVAVGAIVIAAVHRRRGYDIDGGRMGAGDVGRRATRPRVQPARRKPGSGCQPRIPVVETRRAGPPLGRGRPVCAYTSGARRSALLVLYSLGHASTPSSNYPMRRGAGPPRGPPEILSPETPVHRCQHRHRQRRCGRERPSRCVPDYRRST